MRHVPLQGRRRIADARGTISTPDVLLWMSAGFAAALVAATCVVVVVGANERGVDDALLLTGRISFVLFWPAYAGGAAVALFGWRLRLLKRQRRNFGLAFASAHIVHLGLVAWLYYLGAGPPVASLMFFGIAALWTYLLAIISIHRLQRVIGQHRWRVISFIGLNYIAFAFAVDFLRLPPQASLRYVVGYLPFAMLAIGGFALKICFWAGQIIRRCSVNSAR